MTRTSVSTNGRDAGLALADVVTQITGKEQEHERVSRELGDAYARRRTGKGKDTTAEIGRLIFQRTTIENDLRDLRLTEASLTAEAAQQEADEHDRRREAAVTDLARITADARQAQEDLAVQIIAAAETGQRLDQLGRDWARARAETGRFGGDITAYPKAPAPAAALFRPGVLTDPAREVAIWKNSYVAPTAIPPRELTARDHELRLEREAVAARRKDSSEGLFTIVQKMQDKLAQKGA
jgi:hypothetical protein